MIPFALRQFRTQGLIALVVLVALAILALVTGPHLVHLYDTTIVGCQTAGDCGPATDALTAADGHLASWLGALVLIVPAVLGVFWGAPLVARELEAGTFRLVWTQSVTRTRWLAVKLAVVGLAAIVVSGLASLIVTWWASPIDHVRGSGFAAMFDERDIVPVAYAAFAFALGAAVGLLVRRVLPAMAATLAGFIAVRFAVVQWVRPHLGSPIRVVSAFAVPPAPGGGIEVGKGLQAGDWVLNEQTLNRAGRVLSDNLFSISVSRGGHLSVAGQHCPASIQVTSPVSLPDAVRRCADQLGLRQLITYQPQHRYWLFQWEESAIYVVLAGILVAFCFWWVHRTYNGGAGRLGRRGVPVVHTASTVGVGPGDDDRTSAAPGRPDAVRREVDDRSGVLHLRLIREP